MLNKALFSNAIFSSVSALIMFTQSSWLSKVFPLDEAYWFSLALGLGGFAILLVVTAANTKLASKLTPAIIVGDLIWVLSTTVLLIGLWSIYTILAVWLIVGVNIVVTSLAVAQFVGFRRLVM